MLNQFELNERMRTILLDWIVEVHDEFMLMDETLFLTVNIIDRFLSRQHVTRKNLQLVGVTAMLIACKYEDIFVPTMESFILFMDNSYTKTEVLEMEETILITLKFTMFVPTPYVFMRRCLKTIEYTEELEFLSLYLAELSLIEYEMLQFSPSLLAATAIYTAQCVINGFKYWSRMSEVYSGYAEEQLLKCSRKIVDLHQKAGTGKFSAVRLKYSTSRFLFVARCKPAVFLLDLLL